MFDLETETENLKQSLEIAKWVDLKSHVDRGALFKISSELDLIEVGLVLAQDKIDQLKGMMEKGDFQKIESKDGDNLTEYQFVIVQPYVIIKEIEVKK